MGVKIKSTIFKPDDIFDLPEIKRRFSRKAAPVIKKEIIKAIEGGRSPVSQRKASPKNTGGKLRFQKYSESYELNFGEGIYKSKRKRPVNLTLTGKMLKSLKSRITRKLVVIFFQSEIAKYHNKEGAGKSKVIRRLLPQDGEDFTPAISRKIKDILEKVIRLVSK